MESEELYEDLIDRYLLGKLSNNELGDVHKLQEEDPSFARRVDMSRKVRNLVQVAAASELKERIRKYAIEEHKPSRSVFIRYAPLMAVAAVIIIAIGILLNWQSQSLEEKQDLSFTTPSKLTDTSIKFIKTDSISSDLAFKTSRSTKKERNEARALKAAPSQRKASSSANFQSSGAVMADKSEGESLVMESASEKQVSKQMDAPIALSAPAARMKSIEELGYQIIFSKTGVKEFPAYTFIGQVLTLYASYEDKNQEIKTLESVLYLHYLGNFYYIKNPMNVKENLVRVTDPELIKRLNN